MRYQRFGITSTARSVENPRPSEEGQILQRKEYLISGGRNTESNLYTGSYLGALRK